MNWQTPAGTSGAVAEVAQPEQRTRTATSGEEAEGDWLCAWCHHGVANERDRFCYDGKDEFTFTNPEGFRFDIITFSQTRGCRQTGEPTLQHTWFPGHSWSYCQCADCGQHLGWYFAGQSQFAGLIKERIVRALYLRN